MLRVEYGDLRFYDDELDMYWLSAICEESVDSDIEYNMYAQDREIALKFLFIMEE